MNFVNVLGSNKKKYRNTAVILVLCGFLISCIRAEPSRTEFVFGTYCTITLFEQGREKHYREVFASLREVDNLMSVNIPSSDISRVNAAAGIEAVRVNENVLKVIQRAVFFAELSGGLFDPAIGPLVSLWNIGSEYPRVPSQEEINQILPLVNWRDIEIDAENNSVFLKNKGMALDLGAVAKGYAADAAAAVIKRSKIKRAIIDLGGNVLIYGSPSSARPWRVAIQDPKETRYTARGVLNIAAVSDDFFQSIVTSAVYERFFEEDGIRYHHILSTFNGHPVNNGLLSVTIITPCSMDADALSTAVFAMGFEKGKELLDSLPETDAVFIFEDNSVYVTGGLDFGN